MTEQEIQNLIAAGFEDAQVSVGGDGYHFEAEVISDAFEGKRAVQRQQMVYALVNDYIASGELHALSLKTLTKTEASNKEG